jgi:hypothetical protein
MSFTLGGIRGSVLDSLLGTHPLFTRNDPVREIVDRICRKRVKDFLDYVSGALVVACFYIEVSNDGEIQGVTLLRRSGPSTCVMLVITHSWVADALEHRRHGTVRFF